MNRFTPLLVVAVALACLPLSAADAPPPSSAAVKAAKLPVVALWPAGALDLAEMLATKRADEFRRCLAEKMLTYALGRGVGYYDRTAIERIMTSLRDGGDKFSALVLAIAQRFPFQDRRAEPDAAAAPRP